MAILSRKIKLWGGTYLGATQRDAINVLADAYLLNSPDGIATGAKVSTDTLIVDEGRGAQMMIKAVAVGQGEGKTSASALENVSKSFSAALRMENLAADILALQVLIQAWLDNSGDGIASGAPVDVKLSGKNINRGVIEVFVDVSVGAYSEYSYIEDYKFYVSSAGSDTTGTGTADNPLATPQAAVDAIIARGDNSVTVPYTVDIGPGVFDGIDIGDSDIVAVSFNGAGPDVTILDPSSGNSLESTTDNDSQSVLVFSGIGFAEPIVLEGASDSTGFGSVLRFDNCKTSDVVSITNAVQAEFSQTTLSAASSFETVGTVIFGAGTISLTDVTILGDNAAAKKPSGWAGGTAFISMPSSFIFQDLIVDNTKNDAVLRIYGNIGRDLLSPSTRCYIFPGCSIDGNATISGTYFSDNGFIGGNLAFTSTAGVITMFQPTIGGNLTIDPATTSVAMYGGGYVGTLTDTGNKLTYAPTHPTSDLFGGKSDKVSTPTVNAIVILDASGNSVDSGVLIAGLKSIEIATTETSDETPKVIDSVAVAEKTVTRINAEIVALNPAGTGGSGYTLSATARRAAGGNVTMIGTASVIDADEDDGALNVTAVANTGTQSIDIQVVGAAVVEAGDAGNQMASWKLDGVNSTNSDAGVLYWGLVDAAGTRTVSLYKDNAGVNLVAEGSLAGDGVVALAESGGSGITGAVTVTYASDDVTFAANTLTTVVYSWKSVTSKIEHTI